MTINLLLPFFFFIAAAIGFATSLRVMFSKKMYSKSFFLGLFLLSFSVVSVYNFYLSANTFKGLPAFFIISKSFLFLAAPCSFFYVRTQLYDSLSFKKIEWFHFFPFIIYFSLTLYVWSGNYINIYFIEYLEIKTKNPFSILSLTIWFVYVFCQNMLLLNFDISKLKENHSNKLIVLKRIRLYNLIILSLFSIFFVHFLLFNKVDEINLFSYILISILLLFISIGIYFKPQFFIDEKTNENSFVLHTKEINCPNLSIKDLSDEKKKLDLKKLDLVFNSNKLYLKKNLTLKEVSRETGIPINMLSNFINSEYNLNFSDYINLKRIEYFKRKINDADWNDLSIEGMSWASGFNSRITCFRAFIKHTSQSPSEYIKTNKDLPFQTIKRQS